MLGQMLYAKAISIEWRIIESLRELEKETGKGHYTST